MCSYDPIGSQSDRHGLRIPDELEQMETQLQPMNDFDEDLDHTGQSKLFWLKNHVLELTIHHAKSLVHITGISSYASNPPVLMLLLFSPVSGIQRNIEVAY